MFSWLQSRAPVARKLDVAFGAVSLMIAFSGGLAAGACGQLLKASRDAPPALQHAAGQAALIVALGAAASLLASRFIARAANRLVAAPVAILARRMEDFACGDTESPIGFADREDETGRLSRAMRVLMAQAAEAERLKVECDERGRMIAALLDSYYRVAAPGAEPASGPDGSPPGPTPSGLRALEAVFARSDPPDPGSDLRRLLRRLGAGARAAPPRWTPQERDCA